VQLGVAILTDRRDLTSAGLVISSAICLITGIFLAILSTAEPLDTRYVSRLPVQGCINLCRTCADLGIQGVGYFLPRTEARTRTMQFIPVADLEKIPSSGDTFVYVPGSAGMQLEPSGAPLYAEIQNRQNLVVPPDIPSLLSLIREIGEDVLEISDSVTADADGDTVTVALRNYHLIEGCVAIHAESPKCCTMYPCPVCSLFATVICEGQEKIVTVDRCTPNVKERSVTTVFRILPGDDGKPEMKVPVA
jgi:hypothetical protein